MTDPEKMSKIKSFLREKDPASDISNLETPTTPGDHKDFIRKKLTEEPKLHLNIAKNFNFKQMFQTVYSKVYSKVFFFRSKMFKKWTRETLPIGAFITFSCFILWKMEEQLDRMRRKVITTKSLKQLEIEKENELLDKSLHDDKLLGGDVQISDYEPNIKYKFEDDDDEDGVISTQGDTLRDVNENEFKDIPDMIRKVVDRAEKTKLTQPLGNIPLPSKKETSTVDKDAHLFRERL